MRVHGSRALGTAGEAGKRGAGRTPRRLVRRRNGLPVNSLKPLRLNLRAWPALTALQRREGLLREVHTARLWRELPSQLWGQLGKSVIASWPPSMGMVAPVTQRDSSLA